MQQLSSSRVLAERVQDGCSALENSCSGGFSCGLLGQPWLDGSVRQARVHFSATGLFCGLGDFFGLYPWVCSRRARVERMVRRQHVAGPERSAYRYVGGENRKSKSERSLRREFRPERSRSASCADGNGCQFGCACRRESRSKVGTQFRCPGSRFPKTE